MDLFMTTAVGILSLLFAGNIWFIRRLVVKLDKLDDTVTSRLPVQQNEIKNMADKIQHLELSISQIGKDFKDVGQLRERVAVIEYAQRVKRGKGAANS